MKLRLLSQIHQLHCVSQILFKEGVLLPSTVLSADISAVQTPR